MKTLPTSAAANASGRNVPSEPARAVPTSTGAIAAGSVRGRAAISQIRRGTLPVPTSRAGAEVKERSPPSRALRPAGELREVGLALLHVGVAPFLALLGHV